MKRLGTRVNLIPVVAKADTLTQNDLFVFKQRVRGNCIGVILWLSLIIFCACLGSRSHRCAGNPDLHPSAGRRR